MQIKKTTRITTSVLIILAFIGFVLGMVWFFIWKKEEIPGQIIGVLFGTIVTAIVTMLLLNAQTRSEEEHEVSGKIFDKKTEAYLNVLDSLEKIISDGKVDTIRDNRLTPTKKDEFSELLFSLTRLSSFVENKSDSNTADINELIEAVTEIIKTTTDEKISLPGYDSKEFWNGKGKKKPNETQKAYYLNLVESLSKIINFAANNIRRGSGECILNLKKLVLESGLFSEDKECNKTESVTLPSTENNPSAVEEQMDYRIGCIADCLKEMEVQCKTIFGDDNVKRMGNAGDDIYWGRWKDKETTVEIIADWLITKARRNEIGYSVDLDNGLCAELYLSGDAKTFGIYIMATTDDDVKKAQEKHDQIKDKFGKDGWWIPDDFNNFIIGSSYGGEYNGSNIWFDFRNASMEESEYKEAYKKFKENAIQGMISGRDDSIVKATEELKKLIEC